MEKVYLKKRNKIIIVYIYTSRLQVPRSTMRNYFETTNVISVICIVDFIQSRYVPQFSWQLIDSLPIRLNVSKGNIDELYSLKEKE